MAIVNGGEIPDLDSLLNATADDSGLLDCNAEPTFDPNRFAGVVKHYNEKSRKLQKDYHVHMEHQKQKLAEENEAALLEALQQSLQNFQSDHMTDFAALSSTLGQEEGGPSMLKELLMSPYSDNYPREVDSPPESDTKKSMKSSEKLTSSEVNQQSRIGAKKQPIKQRKNFSELLKHMKTSDSEIKNQKAKGNSTGTRLVNSKRYMATYGSTVKDSNKTTIGTEQIDQNAKRVVLRPVAIHGKACTNQRQTLTLALKSSTAAKFFDQSKAKSPLKSIIKLDALEEPAATGGVDAKKIVSGTTKRAGYVENEVPSKRICTSVRTADHDYCTDQSQSNANDTSSSDSKDSDKPSSPKVLKLQDYLKQVREGVRSAPNSTAVSSKVLNGSARQSNNFMVVSLHGNHVPQKVIVNTTAGKSKGKAPVPLPQALKKNTVKTSFELLEFDTYINGIRGNLPSSNETDEKKSASDSLAAMVQHHQRKALQGETSKSGDHQTLCRSKSDGNKSFKTNKSILSKRTPSTSSAGQLLMIQVPVSTTNRTAKILSTQSAAIISSTVNTSTSHKIVSSSTGKDPRTNKSLSSSENVEANGKSQGVPCVSESSGNVTTVESSKSPPTIKLMTCSKNGPEGKSVILKGVGGKLQEVLTMLAEQQAKSKTDKNEEIDDQEQLRLLQNLISCVNSGGDKTLQNSELVNDSPNTAVQIGGGNNGLSTGVGHDVKLEKNRIDGFPISQFETTSEMQLTNGLSEPDKIQNPLELAMTQSNIMCNPQTVDSTVPPSDILMEVDDSNCYSEVELLRVKQDLVKQGSVPDLGSSKKDGRTVDVKVKMDTNKEDPVVLTLDEALTQLEAGCEEESCDNNPGAEKCQNDENLFCKLPSYFMNGKVISEEPSGKLMANDKSNLGNNDGESSMVTSTEELEFNKLPHYLSAGKTRQEASKSKVSSKGLSKGKEYAVKLNPVGDNQHLTPQGTPVDTSETYYSRLPSYYSYGRPHPPVKTFNDDAADAKDDTVTPETLENESMETKHHKHSKKKKSKKRKKKKKNAQESKDETSEKILYSKLPSYYMSSRVLKSREKDNQRISPPRSYSSRSPSPKYYSFSSQSSRSHSRSRSRSRSRSPYRESRSGSRRQHNGRSRSRSSSRSFSESDDVSRRSWRNERRSTRSRREKSFERKRYDTSDEDPDDEKWKVRIRRQEREARKARRQQREKQEKENQLAMEERRVVYVGGIPERTTKQDLREQFVKFGIIDTVSLFFRNDGDNYGFLTFKHTCDAFRAIEEGATVGPGGTNYDLCFGGRRQFCRTRYEDLDSKSAEAKNEDLDDFDTLLQRAQRGLRH